MEIALRGASRHFESGENATRAATHGPVGAPVHMYEREKKSASAVLGHVWEKK